jgi:hypothetical protein
MAVAVSLAMAVAVGLTAAGAVCWATAVAVCWALIPSDPGRVPVTVYLWPGFRVMWEIYCPPYSSAPLVLKPVTGTVSVDVCVYGSVDGALIVSVNGSPPWNPRGPNSTLASVGVDAITALYCVRWAIRSPRLLALPPIGGLRTGSVKRLLYFASVASSRSESSECVPS